MMNKSYFIFDKSKSKSIYTVYLPFFIALKSKTLKSNINKFLLDINNLSWIVIKMEVFSIHHNYSKQIERNSISLISLQFMTYYLRWYELNYSNIHVKSNIETNDNSAVSKVKFVLNFCFSLIVCVIVQYKNRCFIGKAINIQCVSNYTTGSFTKDFFSFSKLELVLIELK